MIAPSPQVPRVRIVAVDPKVFVCRIKPNLDSSTQLTTGQTPQVGVVAVVILLWLFALALFIQRWGMYSYFVRYINLQKRVAHRILWHCWNPRVLVHFEQSRSSWAVGANLSHFWPFRITLGPKIWFPNIAPKIR